MHRTILVLGFLPLVFVLLSACPAADGPQVAATPTYSIEQFLDTELLRGGAISADGDVVLASSDRSGIFNAYAFPTAGGESRWAKMKGMNQSNWGFAHAAIFILLVAILSSGDTELEPIFGLVTGKLELARGRHAPARLREKGGAVE